MADRYSIKDLPDTSKLVDGQGYLVSGKWLNVINSLLKQHQRGENVLRGPGIFKRDAGDAGFTITAATQSSSAGGVADHPYKGYDASTGSTAKVKISYGTHNSLPPTISGTPLNPNRDDNVLTLDGGSSGIVYVECDFATGGSLTSASINSSDSGTPPSNSIASDGSGSAYQTLFAWYVTYSASSNASVTIADNVIGSQGVFICGTSAQFYQGG